MSSEIKANTISEATSTNGVTIDGVKLKDSGIESLSGSRVLASDSGSAWSWGSGVPTGTILDVYQSVNRDAYSQTTNDWDFITINKTFNGTRLYLIGMVSVTHVHAGYTNVGFRLQDVDVHLTSASGNNSGGSWQQVASSTGFKNAERVSNLNASFLYTHGQSTPYTTTIKIKIINTNSSYYYKLNRPADNDANDNSVRTIQASSLTIFDIK